MFVKALKSFIKDESGLETVEYAVMLALIVVVLALAVPTVTNAVTGTYGDVADSLTP